jgi:hypothetical protein
MPFSMAETIFYDTLHLDKEQVLSNPVMAQAKAEGDLRKSMSMRLFAIDLHDYTPNQHLSLTSRHLYNIGATGGEYIRFSLTAVTEEQTKIMVNYTDRWIGIWPPFVFYNPGPKRERNIHRKIWGKKTANRPMQPTGDTRAGDLD